ncbi:type II secretion system F family protein [Pseudomonas sp. NPDC078700]|uniref:type II secretion system F family protein n=1 Tax=Pseudomonas sp. NPDC078700 TaxID=3364424 RepID=UPI0037CAF746
MKAPLLLAAVCLVLAALALLLLQHGWRQSRSEQVIERLAHAKPAIAKQARWGWLERAFLRAGFKLPNDRLGILLSCWIALLVVAQLLGGWMLGLIALVLPLLALHLLLSWRYRRRLRRVVHQLPQMLDQVMRSLQTGRTLGDALIKGIDTSPEPLHGALLRVQRNVQLGVSLPEALDDVAELYQQEELRILALGVKVNHRFGGSAVELLANLIKVIQEREQMARQLRAMTGETRLTAVVLGVLPICMAAYILAVNPSYLMNMWLDSSGQKMLLSAFILQVIGTVMLWRMLRSV